ncbi:hypothetical protein UFOVP597_52 [uncultured Caudovirales phage]|uniref:Uncharacterized protein n=1 Tax=uncultured Caudovirales phage TaxID=2100421 RepID=A0A6J5N4C1_9CAUD|nr:hypothetical protein UFOVP597_52 [uncultured Caudovirales phage]
MKHFINNTEITPRNIFDIGIVCDFTAKIDQNKLTTDTIILPNEGKNLVLDHLTNVGLFEGLPYDIQFANNQILNCYIDFTDSFQVKDKEIEVKIKKRNAHDNFFDNAEGLTFDYLNTQITLNQKRVGYQILPEDSVGQALTCSITLFSIGITIGQQVKEIAETAKEFIAIIGYLPFASQGKAIEAALRLIIQIAFIAVLVYQALKLIERMIELVLPKVRYFNICTCLELLQKGCQQLGYTFKSSILEGTYKNMALLPIPRNKDKKKWYNLFQNDLDQSFQNGFPSAGDSTPTLGTLISAIETMFNGKTRVINGIVQLERWDFWFDKSISSINTSLVLQTEAQNSYSYDFSRLFKRYLIEYATDYSDLNTIDRFEFGNAEYSLERTNIVNNDLNLIKGLTNINIPYSMATTKQKFTWLEKIFADTFKLVDKLAGSNLSAKKSKLGYIQLSQQYFSNTKIFIHDGNQKVSQNSDDILSPSGLWFNFHSINYPYKYQWLIKENVKIPMNSDNFLALLNYNYANIDGVDCEITKLEYFDAKGFALVSYKQPNTIFKNNINILKVF